MANSLEPMSEWTTRRLLQWTTERFDALEMEMPRMQAEMLLAHVLQCSRLRLYMEADRPTSPAEREEFRALVKRALEHEPIDYLLGHAPFYGLTFKVNAHTLVPRPATETLVSFALDKAKELRRDNTPLRFADIGTGSGIIAICVAQRLGKTQAPYCGLASDISVDALQVAQENANTHKVQLQFVQGDLLDPVRDFAQTEPLDLLLSNPPYIPDHEWDAIAPNVRLHEPTTALRGGKDGLDLARPLIEDGLEFVRPGGWMALELASCHLEQARTLASEAGWQNCAILTDHEDLPRVLVAQSVA